MVADSVKIGLVIHGVPRICFSPLLPRSNKCLGKRGMRVEEGMGGVFLEKLNVDMVCRHAL